MRNSLLVKHFSPQSCFAKEIVSIDKKTPVICPQKRYGQRSALRCPAIPKHVRTAFANTICAVIPIYTGNDPILPGMYCCKYNRAYDRECIISQCEFSLTLVDNPFTILYNGRNTYNMKEILL